MVVKCHELRLPGMHIKLHRFPVDRFVPRGLLLPLQRADTSSLWGVKGKECHICHSPCLVYPDLFMFIVMFIFRSIYIFIVVRSIYFAARDVCIHLLPESYLPKLRSILFDHGGSLRLIGFRHSTLQERALVINKNYWDVKPRHKW